MADDNGNGKKPKPLSRAEKFKNYCIGIGAMTGLILGLWANLKGEPKAEEAKDKATKAESTADKTWKTLRDQVNKLAEAQQKLHVRMVHIQAHDEGYRAAKMLLQLQDENDALRKKQPKKLAQLQKKVTPAARLRPKRTAAYPSIFDDPPPKAAKPKPKPCPPGWIRAGKRCRKAPKALAKAVNEAKADAEKARKALEEAKLKAKLEAERRRLVEQKMQAQQTVDIPKPLPPKLDDASKKADK